ncbi:MAG: GNAT family N-acetyltransferase [Alphaproteobacteria bacterium]|nr:GNAT family N-acetyltransferase [Alphaproteobacteria bacterium]
MAKMMRALQIFHGDKSRATADHFVDYCLGAKKLNAAWIALADGMPAGFAVTRDWMNLVRAKPTRTLDLLYVEEKFRGCSIGTAIVSAIAAHALKQGFLRFDTSAATSNKGANVFYKSLGFEQTKHKSNRYAIDGAAMNRLAEQKDT